MSSLCKLTDLERCALLGELAPIQRAFRQSGKETVLSADGNGMGENLLSLALRGQSHTVALWLLGQGAKLPAACGNDFVADIFVWLLIGSNWPKLAS